MQNTCDHLQASVSSFLDEEFDDAEQREFETHLADCHDCQQSLQLAERSHLALRMHLRKVVAAPDLLQKRLLLALDAEDKVLAKSQRQRWLAWSLPAAASLMAAAALSLFIWTDLRGPRATSLSSQHNPSTQVIRDAARQHLRDKPLFVSSDRQMVGEGAASFLETPISPPRFWSPKVRLLGWTPAQLDGRRSATFVYEVIDNAGRHRVHAHAVELADVDLNSQKRFDFDGGTLWIDSAYGFNTVTYAGGQRVGYVFSSDLPLEALVDLVAKTDIVNTLSRAPRAK